MSKTTLPSAGNIQTVPSVPTAPVTSPLVLPQTFNECMTECFAQMGEQTRLFVLNTIKIHIEQMININNVDIDHYKQILEQIVNLLDGDNQNEGFQKFTQLIIDVNILKSQQITQTEVINIIQRWFINENIQIGNTFVTNITHNEAFINEIKNNSVIINAMVNNTITTIINYLSRSPTDAAGDQFVVILSQFINNQVVQITNNLNNQITTVQNNITTQFNVQIENVQKSITQINVEINRINTVINNSVSKEDITNIRNDIKIFHDLRLQFLKLQADVADLINKCNNPGFYAQIDISKNTTIINLTSQVLNLSQTINELNIKIAQCNNFVSREDLANACAAACNVFVNALTGASPYGAITPRSDSK